MTLLETLLDSRPITSESGGPYYRLNPVAPEKQDTGDEERVLAAMTVGSDLTLTVTRFGRESSAQYDRVLAFDSDGNFLTTLMEIGAWRQPDHLQMLALAVPVAERLLPTYLLTAAD